MQPVMKIAAIALPMAVIGTAMGQATTLPSRAALLVEAASAAETVQFRGQFRGHYGPRGYGPSYAPRYFAPRAYGPRYHGAGFYRPWYRRPYYGTILGGIALGTIIGVAAYGIAPRAPRPDLCWYWADRDQSRGYWDYC